jgi:hypothetical protein
VLQSFVADPVHHIQVGLFLGGEKTEGEDGDGRRRKKNEELGRKPSSGHNLLS